MMYSFNFNSPVAFHSSLLEAWACSGKLGELDGLKSDVVVFLLFKIGCTLSKASMETICRPVDNPEGYLERTFHNSHGLGTRVATHSRFWGSCWVCEEVLWHAYMFISGKEVTKSLGDIYSSEMYAWNSKAMIKVHPQEQSRSNSPVSTLCSPTIRLFH